MANTTETIESAEQKRFNEQCFIIYYLDSFIKANKDTVYENFVMVDGNPDVIVSRLVGKTDTQILLNLTPAEISTLVPKLKLFKTIYSDPNSAGTEVELRFDDYLDSKNLRVSDITATSVQRGGGVGIKSFSFAMEGKQVATADKIIKATLTLHFQSIEDLTKTRIDPETNVPYKYLDLLNYTLIGSADYLKYPRGKYNELRAVVGWTTPAGSLLTIEQRRAIERSSSTLVLSMRNHTIDFKEDGTLELKIDYQAYVEAILNDVKADIFMLTSIDHKASVNEPPKETYGGFAKDIITEGVKRLTDQAAEYRKQPACPEKTQQTEDPSSDVDVKNNLGKREKYAAFLKALANKQRIFYLDLPVEILDNWQNGLQNFQNLNKTNILFGSIVETVVLPTLSNLNSVVESQIGQRRNDGATAAVYAAALKVAEEDKLKDREEAANNFLVKQTAATSAHKDYRINYVYFGDILNTALDALYLFADPDRTLRFVCGSIAYTNPINGKSQVINIADIPISLNLFNAWFMKNVIQAGVKENYPVNDFIKDFVSQVILPALITPCIDVEPATVHNLKDVGISVISVPAGEEDKDRITNSSDKFGNRRVAVEDISRFGSSEYKADYRDITKLNHYLILFHNSVLYEDLKRNEEEDNKKGIYWIRPGLNRGLLKRVSFSKEEMPRLEAAVIVGNGSTELDAMRRVYRAQLEMFGNMLFKQGQKVFITIEGIGGGLASDLKSAASRLGLDGYYDIITIEGAIENGKFDTTIKTVFSSPGDGTDWRGQPNCTTVETGKEIQVPAKKKFISNPLYLK